MKYPAIEQNTRYIYFVNEESWVSRDFVDLNNHIYKKVAK